MTTNSSVEQSFAVARLRPGHLRWSMSGEVAGAGPTFGQVRSAQARPTPNVLRFVAASGVSTAGRRPAVAGTSVLVAEAVPISGWVRSGGAHPCACALGGVPFCGAGDVEIPRDLSVTRSSGSQGPVPCWSSGCRLCLERCPQRTVNSGNLVPSGAGAQEMPAEWQQAFGSWSRSTATPKSFRPRAG